MAVLVTLKVAYSEGQGVHLAFPEGFNGGLPICDRSRCAPSGGIELGDLRGATKSPCAARAASLRLALGL